MAKQKAHRFFLYLLLEVLRHFILILPRQIAFALATAFATFTYSILPKERAKTIRHLKEAFGNEKTDQEISEIGRNVFIHLTHSAVDVFRFPLLSRKRIEKLVEADPICFTRLDSALKHGNGAIVLTGHIGNWELLASYFRFFGYPGVLMGRKIYYKRFDQVLTYLRKCALVRTIYRDESPRKVLTELKQNHIVGISADQDIDSLEGIFVSFFGFPTWTPIGPAKLALASGAPIVPGFMIHEKKGYRLFVEEPIFASDTGSKEKNVQKMTEAWSKAVENIIRKYPDQWVWMHNRWKTKPEVKNNVTRLESIAS